MARTRAEDYFVGVDLGGTKILAGIFKADLEPVGCAKVSTKASRGAEAVIERIVRCVREAVDECDLKMEDISGIGIGAPGAVEPETGKVINAVNLGWEEVRLVKALEESLSLPVFLENDCNLCTLGVYTQELESKPQDVVGIFLGTGIGGGLILNGRLYAGFNHAAGEVGHMVVDVNGPKCSCGNRGCFEVLSSRSALFREIQLAVEQGEKSILTEMLGKELKDLRSGDLRKAIRRGDRVVQRIVERAAEFTGIAVSNVINLIHPEVVVLGGGVIEALENVMMPIIVKGATEHVLPGTVKGIQIIASKLGDNAGIMGGAVLAREKLSPSQHSTSPALSPAT